MLREDDYLKHWIVAHLDADLESDFGVLIATTVDNFIHKYPSGGGWPPKFSVPAAHWCRQAAT